MKTELWRNWLARALNMGIAPSAFWRLSLCEWRALAAPAAAPSLDRSSFDALRAQFPDQT